jgi:hypothetical protein
VEVAVEAHELDSLVTRLLSPLSRRGSLAAFGAVAGSAAGMTGGVGARKKRRKNRKRKKKNRITQSPPPSSIVAAECFGALHETPNSGIGNLLFAQPFVAGASGPLIAAELDLSQWPAGTGAGDDFILWLVPVGADGMPTTTILASAFLPGADVPATLGTRRFTFTRPTAVTKGKEYALVVYSVDLNGTGAMIVGSLATPTCGARALWGMPSLNQWTPMQTDLRFRAYVSA